MYDCMCMRVCMRACVSEFAIFAFPFACLWVYSSRLLVLVLVCGHWHLFSAVGVLLGSVIIVLRVIFQNSPIRGSWCSEHDSKSNQSI